MRLRALIMEVIITLVVFAPSLSAQIPALVPLPADLQGELNGVPYRIRVPANWNGTLLVYSYGYAGESYPLPLAPLSTVENTLFDSGFALAAARASGAVPLPPFPDGGYNMKERIQNSAALTAAFRDLVGHPKYTIAWGRSMGGLVSLALIEKFPGLYDGAVPLCAPAVGTPRFFDQKLDMVLTYAVAFGWKNEWGTPDNLRPDLNVFTEVLPHVSAQLSGSKFWKWEFFKRVNRIPDDPSFYSAKPTPSLFQTVWLAFATQGDLNRRAGGRVSQNTGRTYTLGHADLTYLKALGGTPEALLEEMNNRIIYASDVNARNYAEHYYEPTGRITRPVLTLHTTHDPDVIPNNENAYCDAVERQGKSELLMQQFTIGVQVGDTILNTHCTFSKAQYLAGIYAMVHWLETGNKPEPAVFFPESLGFDADFVPDPWPW